MLKPLLIAAVLIVLTLPPAAWAQGCSVRVNDRTLQFSLPCPPSQGNDAGIADQVLAGRPQTARDLETSYNCFFYVQTNVLGQTPDGVNFVTAETPWRGTLEAAHQVPGTDYFGEDFLTAHGYRFVAAPPSLQGASIFEPGDIVMVPGQDNAVQMNEQFKHVAIVYGTSRGTIKRLRQKFDPYNPIVDLTPAEFQRTYPPQGGVYRVYRHAPFVGQITVRTGTYRGNDGYLYATSQLIKIIVFAFTPDGARLRGPINSRNGGLYVTAEGIFHRTANGPLYQLLALYDAQGRGRQFNQTIQLYTCSGNGTAC